MMSISTYSLFCACTQSEIGQTSNISIHHIHCKHDVNIYLLSILCMYTKRDRPNKQHQHSSYSLQTRCQYLLTLYFVHAHKASQVKQATSASIIFIANMMSISTYSLFCACTQSEIG